MVSRRSRHGPLIGRGVVLLCVLGLLLGATAGVSFALLRPAPATASATILINPLDGNPFSTTTRGDNLANLSTEAELVTAHDVVASVIETTGSAMSVEAVTDAVSISVPTNTQLMEITVSTSDRDDALALTEAFAQDFLESRKSRAAAQSDAQITSLNAEIKERESELTALEAALALANDSASTTASVTAQIEGINAQLQSLQSRVAQLRTNPSDPGQLVTPAAIQRTPLWRHWWALSVAGAIAGLVVAGLILLVRRRATTVKATASNVLGTLTLAELAAVRVTPETRNLALAILTAEHQRPLTVLIDAAGGATPQSVDVLALAVASTGNTTVVIDTAGASRIAPAATLVDLLGEAPTHLPLNGPLTVIAPGRFANVEDRLLSPKMSSLFGYLRARANIIFVVSRSQYSSRALGAMADVSITEHDEDEESYEHPKWGPKDLGAVLISKRPPVGRRAGPRTR